MARTYGNIDIRNNSALRLFEQNANGSNKISLVAPGSLSADLTLTLPASDLADGVLSSDGSGALSIAKLVNANVASGAAIAYSKLNLSSSLVNADVASGAAIAFSKMAALTASKALVSDGSGVVSASSVTSTELGHLSGVTSAIQTQFTGKVSTSEKGSANGVATLDAGGKIPTSQLPSSVMEYQGTWDASSNTPTLTDGTGSAGDVYLVSVAGSQNLGSGSITFAVGDWAVYNGTVWQKSINSNAVASVNGFTGAVVLSTSDIAEGSNQYFTTERAQDAVGGALTNSSNIDFTYNDGANTISADLSSSLSATISGKADKSGATFTGALVMDNAQELRFREATGNGTNYVAFKAPASKTGDDTYTLPASLPASSGYVLSSTTGGVMSWAAQSTVSSYKATWANADGTSKAITHSLSSTDVIIQIFDEADNATIDIDSAIRTDANTVTLTASQAPGTNWRVLILAV